MEATEQLNHYGTIDSFPPYVGGDNDTIDEWLAKCTCGWEGPRKWTHAMGAYNDLVKHLNDAFKKLRDIQSARKIVW